MLKTDKFADLHVHTPTPDIDRSYAMFRQLIDLGVKDFNIASITYLNYSVDENIRDLYFKEKIKDARISVFGGLYYSPYLNHFAVPFHEQAQRLLDMGCDGLKFIENKANYRKYVGYGLNSKLYDKMFDMLEEKQVPLLCHVSDPQIFWDRERIKKTHNGDQIIARGWLYDSEDYLTYDAIRGEVMERLERNPRLNIIFAHFFFLGDNIETAQKLVETYPGLKFDLTPGWEMYVGFLNDYDNWRAFFEKYSDRIFYGTDTHAYPMNPKIHDTVRYAVGGEAVEITMPHVDYARMKGFDLSEQAQKNICYDNYCRLIGAPKPVDAALLKEETEKMLKLAKGNGDDAALIARLERILNEL